MKNSRRGFLSFGIPAVVALAALIALPVWAKHSANAPLGTSKTATAAPAKAAEKGPFYLVYVGTYTTKQESKGIYAYNFNPATGEFTSIGLAAETTDPSFVAVHPNGKYLYAVNEIGEFNGQKSGAISSFEIDRKSGKLKFLNQVSTHGAGPCFVSFDKDGRFVLVANYDGGSVATFEIEPDGSLSLAKGFVQHSGNGLDKERQEGPHAHWISVSPDNRFALVADLGLDDVLVYRFDDVQGKLTPQTPPYTQVKAGSGPRHLAFAPNGKFAYLVTEMASTVVAFSWNAEKGTLNTLQTLPMLPQDYSGVKEAAEITVHPNGKFVYASNRGSANSIAAYKVDGAKGTLTPVGIYPSGGKIPRHFAIDPTGKFLIAANADSGNIVTLKIDENTGALSPTGKEVSVPSPVCITFAGTE
ncbi:MAG TPA: lactonase family protein [Candidatus Sulfotelmatobacter sp.]|nr:lactonase family protein [Candidatus Sulfotelmatobacter sp.]